VNNSEAGGLSLLQKLQWESVPKMVMTISTVMTAIEEVITGTTARLTVGDRSASESLKQQQCLQQTVVKQIARERPNTESDFPGAIIWTVQPPFNTSTLNQKQIVPEQSALTSSTTSQSSEKSDCSHSAVEPGVQPGVEPGVKRVFGESSPDLESWFKCRTEFGHQQSWNQLNIVIIVIINAEV